MGLKATRLEGMYFWNVYQEERGIDFNGFFWRHAAGGLLIDPMPMDEGDRERVRALGGVRWILVTNASHLRDAADLREAFPGAEILAPRAEQAILDEANAPVDGWFDTAADLPAPLASDIETFPIPGGKTPGEVALFLAPLKALFFSDLVRTHESGALRLLPDEKIADKQAVLDGIRRTLTCRFDAILIADGDSVFQGAREALCHMLETLPGVFFNRLNLDRLEFVRDERQAGATTESAQLSRHLTCRKLGFHLERLLPGSVACAYHWESGEEELFLVRSGSMTVRTPAGEFAVSAGDIFVFPTGPAGAHQFRNDGDEPCEFLALGTSQPDQFVYYPDTQKVMVCARGELYRERDAIEDYWEGDPTVPHAD